MCDRDHLGPEHWPTFLLHWDMEVAWIHDQSVLGRTLAWKSSDALVARKRPNRLCGHWHDAGLPAPIRGFWSLCIFYYIILRIMSGKSLFFPSMPLCPARRFVLRLKPNLGGANANHGFNGFSLDRATLPVYKDSAIASELS